MSILTGYVTAHSFGKGLSIWCESHGRRYQAYDLEPSQFPIACDVRFELTPDGRLAINVVKADEKDKRDAFLPPNTTFGQNSQLPGMMINDVVRHAHICDQTFVDAILRSGQPGDIILSFTGSAKDAIETYHEAIGYSRPASAVSHVALYVGAGLAIHAVPRRFSKSGGVKKEPVKDAFGGKSICVLRYTQFLEPNMTHLGEAIAERAEEELNKKYEYRIIVDLMFDWMQRVSKKIIESPNAASNSPSELKKTTIKLKGKMNP